MSAPTWATIVGILMMLVAGCGACNGYQQTQFSKVLEKYPEIMDEVKAEMESAKAEAEAEALEEAAQADEAGVTTPDIASQEDEEMEAEIDSVMNEMPEQIQEMMDGIFNMSPEAQKWMIRFGYLTILGSILMLLGGLFLLIPKPFSIKLAYAALIIGIIISVSQHYVLSKEQGNIMSMMSGAGAIMKVVFSLILMAVIFACEKHAYDFEPEYED